MARRRVIHVALVAVGGSMGTGLREAINLTVPSWSGLPVATFTVNVSGAFMLGLLLATVVRRATYQAEEQTFRLFFGTGVLGGFTTYSALSVDVLTLFSTRPLAAVGYALGTVTVGAVASYLGILTAERTPPQVRE